MDQLDSLTNIPNIAIYFGLITQVLPFIIATANRAAWSSFVKWAVASAACFIASLGYFVVKAIDAGDWGRAWDGTQWLTFSLWICAGTAVFYKLYYGAVKDTEQRTG